MLPKRLQYKNFPDKFASLNKIPILAAALAESRRFGGCFAVASQDLNQLHPLYGLDTTRTLLTLLRTKLIFGVDGETTQKMSHLLGAQEIHTANRSVSFWAMKPEMAFPLTDQTKLRPVVSPEALMSLPKRTAYLKLAGPFPITKVEFPLESTKIQAPAFVPIPAPVPAEIKQAVASNQATPFKN